MKISPRMEYVDLRRYIKSKNLQKPGALRDCRLVIDGDSYFKDSYRNSGCQFILGPDCDRYADYLVNKLSYFMENNVICYVIFKGTTKNDLETIRQRHQKTIDNRRNIKNDLENPTYFEPFLVKDIQKQVLQEIGIKYFCCEYDSTESIVSVARTFRCPVLSDNVEYCLYGVSCVIPNSIKYENNSNTLQCTIYKHDALKSLFGVYNKMPILLTVLKGGVRFFGNLPELSQCIENQDISSLIRWVKRQREDVIGDISNIFDDKSKSKSLMELYTRIKTAYDYPLCNLAVNYFQRTKQYGLFKNDKKWFSRGVASGRIAIPYIDIKRRGFITGSTLVNDVGKPDALNAAFPIISYSHCLLTNSQKSTLKFIGRQNTSSTILDVDRECTTKISNMGIFTPHKLSTRKVFENLINNTKDNDDSFALFFEECLPGHNSRRFLRELNQCCKILVMTLVYYIHTINKDFIDGAYFILLSHLMLDHVSRKLDNSEEIKPDSPDATFKECQKMYDVLNFLFRKPDSKHEINTNILHNLAEFLHSLQHINYLNKLCGERFTAPYRESIPCTVYHDTYNATFVYNNFMFMKNKDTLMMYLETHFKETWPLNTFKSIIAGFEKCLNPPELSQKEKEEPELLIQFFTSLKYLENSEVE